MCYVVSIVPKYFKSVGTQLEISDHEKLLKICKLEGETPYAVLKVLVTDYIKSYPFPKEQAPQPQKTLDVGDGLNDPSRGRGKATHKS